MRRPTKSEWEKLQTLSSSCVQFALLEPTLTGLRKSILDATQPVRALLKNKKVHDYDSQGQGPEHKRVIKSILVEGARLIESRASLYRPKTKSGDPRIWFSRLNSMCEAGDIIALVAFQRELWVLNLSKLDINALLATTSPLKDMVDTYTRQSNYIAEELLHKLRVISAKGHIPAPLNADTAVGRLLERELNIKMNSDKAPDYKGIELKSFRDRRGSRKNLFAQVADWERSLYKGSGELLKDFGYYREGIKRLYCTVSTQVYNSRGLRLRVDNGREALVEFSEKNTTKNLLVWSMQTLSDRLAQKHSETFWIKADESIRNGQQYFQFTEVEHTRDPIVAQFSVLLDSGEITLDHLIKEKGAHASEKGPLFKLRQDSLPLLFPPSITHDLTCW